jgi:hypothetical protein
VSKYDNEVICVRHQKLAKDFSAMKMKATIEVEFEANEDQDENVLRAALFRGRSGLAQSIEYGTGRASTGIQPGSVRIEITKSEVSD